MMFTSPRSLGKRSGGLTCVRRHSGHGFFIDRATQRTF